MSESPPLYAKRANWVNADRTAETTNERRWRAENIPTEAPFLTGSGVEEAGPLAPI